MVHPKVLNFAKEFWNCSHAEGIPLENDGGRGTSSSHWEKSSLTPELMTGSSIPAFYYSEFTVKTLESTKWYIADYSNV